MISRNHRLGTLEEPDSDNYFPVAAEDIEEAADLAINSTQNHGWFKKAIGELAAQMPPSKSDREHSLSNGANIYASNKEIASHLT